MRPVTAGEDPWMQLGAAGSPRRGRSQSAVPSWESGERTGVAPSHARTTFVRQPSGWPAAQLDGAGAQPAVAVSRGRSVAGAWGAEERDNRGGPASQKIWDGRSHPGASPSRGEAFFPPNPLYVEGSAHGGYGQGAPPGGFGASYAQPRRRSSSEYEGTEVRGALQEQWRAIQASAYEDALLERRKDAAHALRDSLLRRAKTEFKYSLHRAVYLLDSKAGSFGFQVAVLALFALVVSLSMGKVISLVRNAEAARNPEVLETNYGAGVWLAWSLLTDPGWGTWPDPGVQGIYVQMVAQIEVLIGILFLATIVGIIADAIGEKMIMLKKGLSPVREAGHTVILGWSESSLTVVKELALSNASEGGGIVVVLSDADKESMERDLLSYFTKARDLMLTKVVFRSGSRLHKTDLSFVACKRARSIIVVSDPRLDPDTADAETLQVVLNLTTLKLSKRCIIAVEVRDKDNEALVQLIGKERVSTVPSHDIIGRLMLLFMRQPGLARVYHTVLGFSGNEFYVKYWEQLVGARWKDVLLHFADAVPIGLQRPDKSVLLNPPPGYIITPTDSLVVLAEDNDTYEFAEAVDVGPRRSFRDPKPSSVTPEVVLFAGWRRDVAYMVTMLDKLSTPNSELHILCPLPVKERMKQFAENAFDPEQLINLRIVHHVGCPVLKRCMSLLPIGRLTSAIVMADRDEGSHVINSDSQCLATLMLIRGLQSAHARARATGRGAVDGNSALVDAAEWNESEAISSARAMPIVVEILDPRTQRTVNDSYKVWSISDFIQSNELMSKMMAMISEEAAVKKILDQLMGETGTQFELQPAEKFVAPDQEASFWELARECTLTRHAILCGYVEPTEAGSRSLPECIINPPDKLARRRWRAHNLVLITTNELAVEGDSANRAHAPSPSHFSDSQHELHEEQPWA